MDASEIQELIESYPVLAKRYKQLNEKLMKSGGRNPMQEESLMQRLGEIENKMEFVNSAAFDSDFLSDREKYILTRRSDGDGLTDIAEFISLSREGIRTILKKAYKKIEDNYKKIAV